MEDKKKIEDIQTKTYLEKNLEFLVKIDLEKRFNTLESIIVDLTDLYFELFDSLVIDDSLVFELHKDEAIDLKKVEEATSIVQKFNVHSKFLTLLENHEEVLKSVLGKDIFKNKKDIAKREKWSKETKKNKKWR